MDIIDFHAHIFPDTLAERAISKLIACSPGSINHTNGTAMGLQQSMKKYGIKKSVLLPVATKRSQVRGINDESKLYFNNDFVPFGALHPKTDNFQDEIDYLKANKIKGIKFHPEYQDFYIDSKDMYPIYEALSNAELITVFHAGKDPGPFTGDHSLPASIKKVHLNFPHLTIVAAHLGGWKVWDQVEEILSGLPIFLDTAAVQGIIKDEEFLKIVQKHGAERILFGTDTPWFDQGATFKWIDNMKISEKEKEAIFFKNACDLIG